MRQQPWQKGTGRSIWVLALAALMAATIWLWNVWRDRRVNHGNP